MKIILLFILLGCLLNLLAINDFELVKNSGVTSSDSLLIMVNSSQAVELLTKHMGTISAQPMEFYPMYSSTNHWYAKRLALPNSTYIGFRTTTDSLIVNPIYWSNVTQLPTFYDLSLAETDPQGDHLFNSTNLDILSSYATFNTDKLYFGIKNNGGGFPTGSGFTFYSYMVVIVNPDANPNANPPVYGLMYTVNLSGIITSGLYKITGTSTSDLTQIGAINSLIDANNNTLILSCNLADLIADADFAAWFNLGNPRFVMQTITSKITLTGGSQTSDATEGCIIVPKIQQINLQNDHLPTITVNGFYIDLETNEAHLIFTFHDDDGNLPWNVSCSPSISTYTANINTTNDITYEACFLDYGDDFTISVTDNGSETVELYYNNPLPLNDNVTSPRINLYPNPVYNTIYLDKSNSRISKITIFNLRGQRINPNSYHLFDAKPALPQHEIDVSKLPSGIYILKLETNGQTLSRKFIKCR